MAMQNYMWNGEGKKAYLYDNNLNLINEADFSGDEYSGRVYSVDYFKNNYIVQLVHGGNQKSNDPISYSYYQSNDFTNWTECEKPNKISNYKIIYENGITSFGRSITGAFFTSYNSNTDKAYISTNGIYSIEIPKLNGNDLNWEDSDYLYFLSSRRCIKISKHSLSEQLNDIENAPQIVLNDTLLAFEQPPVIESDRILVPMRFLFEQMGATVDWNNETQTATVQRQGKEIAFSIDSTKASVGSEVKTMDVPARLINNKTMVPLRFLSEGLGYTVQWDGEKNMATISK